MRPLRGHETISILVSLAGRQGALLRLAADTLKMNMKSESSENFQNLGDEGSLEEWSPLDVSINLGTNS